MTKLMLGFLMMTGVASAPFLCGCGGDPNAVNPLPVADAGPDASHDAGDAATDAAPKIVDAATD